MLNVLSSAPVSKVGSVEAQNHYAEKLFKAWASDSEKGAVPTAA